MAEFVDIHSHVLHGLDDGAKTLEDSLEMLSIAERSGTTDIVATPHANSRFAFRPDRIEERIAELSGKVDIRIHPGCDFHLQVDNIQAALADPAKFTIDHGEYLLVELPESTFFSSTDEILQRLINAGMRPIITHPERNTMVQRNVDELAKWVDLGCYVQVTAGAFTGIFGGKPKTFAHDLLKRGLVHFVASDAHDTRFRTPSLREAYDYLAGVAGEDRIRPLFVDNPRAVLAGGMVDDEIATVAVTIRRWYQLW